MDGLFNDTTHISLRWIYQSAKIDWTKKNPFEYIVPPSPLNWGSEQKIAYIETQIKVILTGQCLIGGGSQIGRGQGEAF